MHLSLQELDQIPIYWFPRDKAAREWSWRISPLVLWVRMIEGISLPPPMT